MIRVIALALLLTACATTELPADRFTAAPVPAQCDAMCTTTCLPAQWPKWEGDPDAPETWDRLPIEVGVPLRETAQTCDKARNECVKCLRNLEDAALICGIDQPCTGVVQ